MWQNKQQLLLNNGEIIIENEFPEEKNDINEEMILAEGLKQSFIKSNSLKNTNDKKL